MSNMFQRHYPNTLTLVIVPGVTTWVVIATDGSVYASLTALKAANKAPWPQSYSGQAGIDYPGGLGPLELQAEASGGGTAGSTFYSDVNLATAPSGSNNPSMMSLATNVPYYLYDDVGNLWNLWVRMGSATDILHVALRY